jgi:5-methylcytosine-specific restriction protein A
MAKITIAQAKVTYSLGQQVFADTLGITDARRQVASLGINSTTGRDLILNVRHMLKGRAYQRHMGLDVTRSYIEWIDRDYGVEAAMRALDSVARHLEYSLRIGQGYPSPTDRVPSPTPLRLLVAKLRQEFGARQEPFVSPEEIPLDRVYPEGTTRTMVVDRYERDPRARFACIKFHGTNCTVCAFNFETHYGDIGQGFIHVHHLRELASVGKSHVTDPKLDLRPVCPNCHAMLHRRTRPFSIEELRAKLRR